MAGHLSRADVSTVARERIERCICVIRSEKVLLDADLAALYEVETKALNQAVKRNRGRFPDDFMFTLTDVEWAKVRAQRADTTGWGGRRSPPRAFTVQGVAMLSSVLRSERAVAVNIEIMRAFVRLRALLASHDELRRKLSQLERKYDQQFKVVFDAIRALMSPPEPEKKSRIGFRPTDEDRSRG